MTREELEHARAYLRGETNPQPDFPGLARLGERLLAEVEVARDAALEEAERRMEGLVQDCEGHSPISEAAFSSAADAVRALKTQPTRRFAGDDRLTEVLASVALDAGAGKVENTGLGVLLEIAHRLGLPRDSVTPPGPGVESAACTSDSSQVKP